MWIIKVVWLNNFSIIFNFLDNYLLEIMILNYENIPVPAATQNGIRATQISFAGALENNFNLNEIDFNYIVSLNMDFINNEIRILRLNNLLDYEDFSSTTDFNDNYISDEDFSYDRYEWTHSECSYDDTDWQYPSP